MLNTELKSIRSMSVLLVCVSEGRVKGDGIGIIHRAGCKLQGVLYFYIYIYILTFSQVLAVCGDPSSTWICLIDISIAVIGEPRRVTIRA